MPTSASVGGEHHRDSATIRGRRARSGAVAGSRSECVRHGVDDPLPEHRQPRCGLHRLGPDPSPGVACPTAACVPNRVDGCPTSSRSRRSGRVTIPVQRASHPHRHHRGNSNRSRDRPAAQSPQRWSTPGKRTATDQSPPVADPSTRFPEGRGLWAPRAEFVREENRGRPRPTITVRSATLGRRITDLSRDPDVLTWPPKGLPRAAIRIANRFGPNIIQLPDHQSRLDSRVEGPCSTRCVTG